MASKPVSRTYIVDNEEILPLVDLWQAADSKGKNVLANQVVSRLGFLVHSKVKAHRQSPFYEDLVQEGRLGIVRALEDFRSERGRNFFLFATWHIQSRVRRFLKCESRRRETPFGDETPCENPSEWHDALEVREERDALVRALDFLPDNDRRVLAMRFGFDGETPHTFQQIGNILGISKQRAQQIGAGAVKRLRGNYESGAAI